MMFTSQKLIFNLYVISEMLVNQCVRILSHDFYYELCIKHRRSSGFETSAFIFNSAFTL